MSVRTEAAALSHESIPAIPQRPLPLEIKSATQSQHIALNRLITHRLPLCLPPSTRTPHLYTVGLAVFGSIYTSFEREWQHFLKREEGGTSRMVEILQKVQVPGLLRTKKLKREMESMQSFTENIYLSDRALDDLQANENAISASICENPHVVMAYTWVMYMALFNGGRIIRDALAAAGPDFWQVSTPSADSEEEVPLTLHDRLHFWHFDSPNDGDDIKEDFKKRFETAAAQLTASERDDVVDEAVRIFAICHKMVDWLDTNISTGRDTKQAPEQESEMRQSTLYESAVSNLFATAVAVWDMLLSIYYYFFVGSPRHEAEVKMRTIREKDANIMEGLYQDGTTDC